MPTTREMLLYTRAHRAAYDAWRKALEYLAYGVDERTGKVRSELIVEAITIEAEQTPMLLFTSRNATLAALYAMGYGKHRSIVAPKMVEMRLAP